MSDYSKLYNNSNENYLKVHQHLIDLSVASNQSVGCHYINNAYAPADHYLVDAKVYAEDDVESVGSALSISIGFDNPTTEPDNILNDCAETDLDTSGGGDIKAGEVVLGTAATHIAVGALELPLAYEIKTEAATAGRLRVTLTYLPY